MTYRLRKIVVAVALALVAALLTMYYVTQYQRDVRKDETNVPVYVAKRDIPVGTSGSELVAKGLLERTELVRRSVVPGAISSPEQLESLVSVQSTFAGEQVTTRRFAVPEARGIQAQLKGTQRAVAVPGDRQQLLVGTIKTGDRVDLIADFKLGEGDGAADRFSRIVVRDIRVLKAPVGGAAAEKLTSSADGDFAAMLALTDVQTQKVSWTLTFAEGWRLELRPVADAADSPENVESALSMLVEGVRPKQLEAAGVGGGLTP
jgi:Flp pilus assembly protein CpaB